MGGLTYFVCLGARSCLAELYWVSGPGLGAARIAEEALLDWERERRKGREGGGEEGRVDRGIAKADRIISGTCRCVCILPASLLNLPGMGWEDFGPPLVTSF